VVYRNIDIYMAAFTAQQATGDDNMQIPGQAEWKSAFTGRTIELALVATDKPQDRGDWLNDRAALSEAIFRATNGGARLVRVQQGSFQRDEKRWITVYVMPGHDRHIVAAQLEEQPLSVQYKDRQVHAVTRLGLTDHQNQWVVEVRGKLRIVIAVALQGFMCRNLRQLGLSFAPVYARPPKAQAVTNETVHTWICDSEKDAQVMARFVVDGSEDGTMHVPLVGLTTSFRARYPNRIKSAVATNEAAAPGENKLKVARDPAAAATAAAADAKAAWVAGEGGGGSWSGSWSGSGSESEKVRAAEWRIPMARAPGRAQDAARNKEEYLKRKNAKLAAELKRAVSTPSTPADAQLAKARADGVAHPISHKHLPSAETPRSRASTPAPAVGRAALAVPAAAAAIASIEAKTPSKTKNKIKIKTPSMAPAAAAAVAEKVVRPKIGRDYEAPAAAAAAAASPRVSVARPAQTAPAAAAAAAAAAAPWAAERPLQAPAARPEAAPDVPRSASGTHSGAGRKTPLGGRLDAVRAHPFKS
jgi:hypothetical protein